MHHLPYSNSFFAGSILLSYKETIFIGWHDHLKVFKCMSVTYLIGLYYSHVGFRHISLLSLRRALAIGNNKR